MSKYAYEVKKASGLRALHDHVLVSDMHFGERRLGSGIVLLNDDGKGDGIRPRWGRVFAIGPEQTEVAEGQWILIAHGRWTRANEVDINGEVKKLRRIDPKDILLISDEPPAGDDTLSDAVSINAKVQ